MNKKFKNGISMLGFSLISLSTMAQSRPISSFDRPIPRQMPQRSDNTRIQVAILLDTSNSMDGLIDQAKSRLWNIINTLSTLRYGGKTPTIEIALYEYGNSNLSPSNGYIRQVVPLSTDLDLISQELFNLRTNGGQEYCGTVISKATRDLEWSNNRNDIKLIYIAGNEPFTQGKTSYIAALDASKQKGISTTTIFCGDFQEGVNSKWRDGAMRGNGKYFNINSDERIRFIETPYDDQINVYNQKLNSTYISYGAQGMSKKSMQAEQDVSAESMSKANKVERVVSKSKAAYTNSNWDLVDLSKNNPAAVTAVDRNYLPAEIKDKSDEEIKKIVKEKQVERAEYQKKIDALAKQRQAYIDKKTKEAGAEQSDDLGSAINSSIVELAKSKGYSISK